MITFSIGLFIGALVGFVFAALISNGKKADAYVYKRLVLVEKRARIGKLGQQTAGLGS